MMAAFTNSVANGTVRRPAGVLQRGEELSGLVAGGASGIGQTAGEFTRRRCT